MGFQLNTSVLNQKGSPAIYTDTFANRPAFGYAGRLFISNDTAAIYEDTGTAWVLIANVSSGAGTLQQVTTNGNTSNVGISVTAGGVSSNSLTVTTLTPGSVPFVGTAGLITQDNTNLFFDDTNNRLGINTNTPGNTLDVHTAGTNPILALNNTAGNQSAISFLNTSVSQWRIGNKATTNNFDIFNFILNNHAIRINSGDNSIEITNNINVQSNGSIFGSNANGSDPFRIQANNVQKVIRFLNSAAGTADLYVAGTSTSSAFYFSTFSTANALRIENSGNVLITTTSDDGVNKLQVTGSARITGDINLPYGSIINWNSSSNQYIYADANFLYIGAANFSRITISTSGVLLVADLAGTGSRAVLADTNGNLSAPVSDVTVKENVQNLKYGLDAIMQLNPISFEYINEYKNYGEGLQIGNIAQDVEKVIPEAVFTTPSTGLKGINYNQFDGIYIKAIQDLNNIIDGLLKRIELLENK